MFEIGFVGVKGYGWYLLKHLRPEMTRLGCRLAAAADQRWAAMPDRAAELRAAGVELFDDAIAMFDAMRGRCQAMYIATGMSSHEPLGCAAMERGYHVHIEKPPAATMQELDRLLTCQRRTGVLGMFGFHGTHRRDLRALKQRIAEGRIGRVLRVSCWCGSPRMREYYARNEWAGRLKVGGRWVLDGPAINAMAHAMNAMLLLASPKEHEYAMPQTVRAELYAAGPTDSHDTACIDIRTAEGAQVFFACSHCSEGEGGGKIRIQAERGAVELDMGKGPVTTYADGTREEIPASGGGGREMLLPDFMEAIRTGDESPLGCPLASGRAFMLAINGAHESSGSIHRIPPQFSRRVDEGTDKARTAIDGMEALLASAADEGKVFSELPSPPPPWAARTEPFDLAGYASFPQRFKAI